MKTIVLALAALPLLSTAAFAQSVDQDVHKQLWCGTALVAYFSAAPSDAPSEQLSMAQGYIDAGNDLIDKAGASYLSAGFTQEQFDTQKADLTTQVTAQVTGQAAAEYSFEECAALLPPAGGASSAM